jgi:hypothetical protein
LKIDFDLRYFFSPDSSPAEKAEAKAIIQRTSLGIADIYRKASRKPPAVIVGNAGGNLIRFDLPGMFSPDRSAGAYTANARTLRALVEALIELNMIYLRAHPYTPRLYDMGIRYGRTQIWDTVSAFQERGFGDCKTLTAILCAERRLAGRECDPVHRFMLRKDNGLDYHILVARDDGSYEDPSKVLGMGKNENSRF